MLLALLGLVTTPAPAFLRMPDIHGDKVAFVCEGDVWLGSRASGTAVRLTRDAGEETYPKFSPDGAQIAFSASYDGLEEVYVIPTEGGAPRRITYRFDYAMTLGWTPDGKGILYRGRALPRSFGLWVAPVEGGPARRLPTEFASHADYTADGSFVWTRFNRANDAWFRYIGGMQNQIWTGNEKTKTFRQLTKLDGTNEFPVSLGSRVYFAQELDGKFRVRSVALTGGSSKVEVGPYDIEVRELSAGEGGVVYEKGRGIELLDPAGKVQPLDFKLTSDLMHTRPYLAKPEAHVSSLTLTPGAKRVLVESRGQIVSAAVGEGETRVWKAVPGARLRHPKMSPDAKSIAYLSDETGEMQLVVAKADGTEPKVVTKDAKRQLLNLSWSPDSKWIALNDSEMRLRLVNPSTGEDRLVHTTILSWGGTPHSFSPDSKWLAYTQIDPITNFTNMVLYSIEKSEKTVVAGLLSNDSAPTFSPDGKYLGFLSARNLSTSSDPVQDQLNFAPTIVPCLMVLKSQDPSPLALKDPNEDPEAKPADDKKKDDPFRIDFDGLYDRVVQLPVAPGRYSQIDFAPSGRVLLAGDGEIKFFDLEPKKSGTLTPGGGFSLSKDRTKALVGMRVVSTAGADIPPTVGAINMGGLQLSVEPTAEWKQIFWDAWRLLRDYFYVANMHGHDWKAIGDKYAALLPSIRSRDELDILIRWMQAELGSSHQYLSPGDGRDISPKQAGAFLGIDVAPEAGGLKITKILRGDGFSTDERSPLLEPGLNVKEGLFIVELAGQPVSAKTDYLSLLVGRSGRTISMKINDRPALEGSRTILVKPIPNETRLRRLEWVAENRRMVDKLSGGKVGYLYLGAMTDQDMQDFARQYFPQRNKDAMIVDSRFNNGGYTQNYINRILDERLTGFFNMRSSAGGFTRQGMYYAGPIAILQNEFNVSCGEEFPHRFRELKRGVVIGRRTYGGEVGSSPGWPLVDGGVVSVPNYGMWTPKDGWVIEGAGVDPDIDVPSDPNLYAAGRDPQLEKAVAWNLDELRKKPPVKFKAPADRIRIKP